MLRATVVLRAPHDGGLAESDEFISGFGQCHCPWRALLVPWGTLLDDDAWSVGGVVVGRYAKSLEVGEQQWPVEPVALAPRLVARYVFERERCARLVPAPSTVLCVSGDGPLGHQWRLAGRAANPQLGRLVSRAVSQCVLCTDPAHTEQVGDDAGRRGQVAAVYVVVQVGRPRPAGQQQLPSPWCVERFELVEDLRKWLGLRHLELLTQAATPLNQLGSTPSNVASTYCTDQPIGLADPPSKIVTEPTLDPAEPSCSRA